MPLEILWDNNSANSIVTNNGKSNRTKLNLMTYAFVKDIKANDLIEFLFWTHAEIGLICGRKHYLD